MTIEVKQNLVSSSKYNVKCPYSMDAEFITYHNTANDASAQSEIKYMISNNNSVSYHFAIDDIEVIQGIPLNRNAWHCGDGGTGKGNRKSIGVEVCYSKSGGEKYYKAEKLANKFIAQLLHERGWGVERVKPHHSWSGKNCPHRIRNEGRWNEVVNDIQNELDKLKEVKVAEAPKTEVKTEVVTKPSVSPTPSKSSSVLGKGDTGSKVKELQLNLIKLGYKLPKYGADSDFGDEVLDSLKQFQKDHGLVVDGLFGDSSRNKIQEILKKKSTPSPSVKYPGYLFKVQSPLIHNEDVGRIQRALNKAAGKQVVKVDNWYGDDTARQVGLFQSRHDLKADGIVGKNTWNKLFK